jgi:solute carrier family 27 (fatty acid transporter), member 1/4
VEELSWQVAKVFHNIGLQKGDVVALVSTNRPEYVAIWVGLSRLGVVTALVNNSLRNMALQHSLKVVNPKAVIASADLCQGDLLLSITMSLRN